MIRFLEHASVLIALLLVPLKLLRYREPRRRRDAP